MTVIAELPVTVPQVATMVLLPVDVMYIVKVEDPTNVKLVVPDIVEPPLSLRLTSHEFVVVALFESDIVTVTVKSKLEDGLEVLGETEMVLKAEVPVTVKLEEDPVVKEVAEAWKTKVPAYLQRTL
jgi:hypothetical protein